MHTIKMALLAAGPSGVPSYDDVLSWARERLLRIPPLRWKVLKVPFGLAKPVFIDIGEFDVSAHVRTERLPARGGSEQLDDLVSRIASVQIDRSRPLWELTYVEGLDPNAFGGAEVALVFKLHHAIMDGQASVRFL